MNILHVTTQKPYSTGSGVYLSGLLKVFAREDRQHLICGLNRTEDAAWLSEEHGFSLDPVLFQSEALPFAVPGMSDVMPYTSRRYDSLSEREAAALKEAFLKRVEEAVEAFRPDVVLCQHLYLITALTAKIARARGLPVAGVCHGSDLRQFQNTDRWREEIRSGIGQLDLILATHAEQAAVIRELFDYPAERIRIMGSGFDSEIFRPDPAVSRADHPIRIVYTGKLAAAKGVPELLSATDLIAEQQDIHLTLIGGGGDPEEAEAIRQAGAEKPYPVVLTGLIRQAEAAAIYRQSHIFVLPSYYEGMPLVVPEALATGLKVAVTDLPGFRRWLEPFKANVGFIRPPAMESLDRPTEEARSAFIAAIAEVVLSLIASGPPEPVDLSDLSWQGLAGRIRRVLKELTGAKGAGA